MSAPSALYPDLNSNEYSQVVTWLLAIQVGKADVINGVAVSKTERGYYVQGYKKPMAYPDAAMKLLRR